MAKVAVDGIEDDEKEEEEEQEKSDCFVRSVRG